MICPRCLSRWLFALHAAVTLPPKYRCRGCGYEWTGDVRHIREIFPRTGGERWVKRTN